MIVVMGTEATHGRSHHYSSYSDKPEFYLDAIQQSQSQQSQKSDCHHNIRAGIVTHHLLARTLMADFFECLAMGSIPNRVILIGPDHFRKSSRDIATSEIPWITPFGELSANPETTSLIRNTLDLPDDSEALTGEHSISALIPFVRFYFPNSSVVPLIIQKNPDRDTIALLRYLVVKFLEDPGTIVLLSMDFVHNQTADEADRRDILAQEVIMNLDSSQVDRLDIDCHPGLAILLSALKVNQNIVGQVLDHTNSSRIIHDGRQKDVTSYFTIIFYKKTFREKNAAHD